MFDGPDGLRNKHDEPPPIDMITIPLDAFIPFGSYEEGDVPKQIVKIIKMGDTFRFTVSWKPREDGAAPKDTELSNLELRRCFP